MSGPAEVNVNGQAKQAVSNCLTCHTSSADPVCIDNNLQNKKNYDTQGVLRK